MLLLSNRKLHLFYTNNRHVVFARNFHWFVFICWFYSIFSLRWLFLLRSCSSFGKMNGMFMWKLWTITSGQWSSNLNQHWNDMKSCGKQQCCGNGIVTKQTVMNELLQKLPPVHTAFDCCSIMWLFGLLNSSIISKCTSWNIYHLFAL